MSDAPDCPRCGNEDTVQNPDHDLPDADPDFGCDECLYLWSGSAIDYNETDRVIVQLGCGDVVSGEVKEVQSKGDHESDHIVYVVDLDGSGDAHVTGDAIVDAKEISEVTKR
ncbi:hypothetical protein HLRTI_002919 [Halorhabdus tiamatea SARL4B]|uniref:Uncharacterized protein n=1 Tax=Halorhabdus tiamatea SARL4B TaxID=1033806 RepID=U2F460_9EURY|nr:hypothetical protein [Halorhabdus tiamatea]ERJ05120.1 hypothetical protein HLRTI_002919 [Halorhabdus tiamatea SARL4B]